MMTEVTKTEEWDSSSLSLTWQLSGCPSSFHHVQSERRETEQRAWIVLYIFEFQGLGILPLCGRGGAVSLVSCPLLLYFQVRSSPVAHGGARLPGREFRERSRGPPSLTLPACHDVCRRFLVISLYLTCFHCNTPTYITLHWASWRLHWCLALCVI